jgi:SAM-dependent methyltransferase
MGTPESVPQSPGLPPQLILYQMATGHYLSRALNLVAKLGIADLLKDSPRHYGELARMTATHAPSLMRVLRLLASVGIFEEQEAGKFAQSAISESLRADVPGSSRAMVMLFGGKRIQDAWRELEHCVRTGEPEYRMRGVTNPFDDPMRDRNELDTGLADYTRLVAAAVAAVYDFTPFRTVVDVGGGNGALIIGILKANPPLRGIVFEHPLTAESARREIEKNGLADRCTAIGGDFFKEVPAVGDAYILKHVIHDWDDEHAVTILKNCRAAMKPDGRLLIVEGVYPPRIDRSKQSRAAATDDVNMMVLTGGRHRSEPEFRSLYETAGFKLTGVIPTRARDSVIEGVLA